MADRNKDSADRLLEAMLASEPIDDGGFSQRILRRIRRRLWIRRLALPVAMLAGTAVAARPALELVNVGSALIGVLPSQWTALPADLIPQLPVLLLGAALLVVGMLTARMLAE